MIEIFFVVHFDVSILVVKKHEWETLVICLKKFINFSRQICKKFYEIVLDIRLQRFLNNFESLLRK
jgi:hypothetical protein